MTVRPHTRSRSCKYTAPSYLSLAPPRDDDVGNAQLALLAVAQQALVDDRDQDQRGRVEIQRSCRRGQRRALEIGEQPLDQSRVVLEVAALVGQRPGDLVGSVGGASRVRVDGAQKG